MANLPSIRDLPPGPAARLSKPGLESVHDLEPGPAPQKKKGGGGFLGAVKRFPGDVIDLATGIPAGLVAAGTAGVHDITKGNIPIPWDPASIQRWWETSESAQIDKQMAKSAWETAQHPGRNLAETATVFLPALGGAAKLGLVAKGVKAGEISAGGIPEALISRPPRTTRTLRSGGLEVHPESSNSALGQVIQGATDSLFQGRANANPTGVSARVVNRKVGKTVTARTRAAERAAKAQGAALIAAGKKLSDGEQKALQLVAEQAPLSERILTEQARMSAATSPAAKAAHQAELDLLYAARQHLVDDGTPVFAPGQENLSSIYDQMAKAAGDRETLLKNIGMLSEESAQGRKTSAGRVAIGAKYEEYFAPASFSDLEVGQSVRIAGQKTVGKVVDVGNHSSRAVVTVFYPRFNKSVKVPIKRVEVQGAPGIVGAEHFTAGPEAVRIPDVLKNQPKSAGVIPRLGSRGLIGELKAPKSLTETYTGKLREHAVRRQDTTRLVGESSIEASKYAAMFEIHEFLKVAAREAPSRTDDIAIRLDDTRKTPNLVKEFLGDPDEFFQRSNRVQAATKLEHLRSSLFMDPKTLTPAARAEFAKLEQEGKIGWVPRSVLGDLAKSRAPLSAVTGTKPVGVWDTINNASRFAILYLKPAYAVPNMIGNAGLNLVQQGFAAPQNLARAARIMATDKELAAMLRVNMGEGLSTSLNAQGGRLARATDATARVWSYAVDEPFRLASFIHEARLAGYKTNADLKRLLSNPSKRNDLYEVSTRANREIIDYGNLSPIEKEIIRRVVFFYPWVKGSTTYAGRTIREHPLKTGVQGQIGQMGTEYSQEKLGDRPSFLRGIIPYGGGLTGNPAAAAILQTPATAFGTLTGLLTGDYPGAASQASTLLTPALSLLLAEALRTDPETGRAYKGGTGPGAIAYDQLVKNLPQAALARNLDQALSGEGKDRLYPPSVQSSLVNFLLGGIAPRETNLPVLNRMARSEERKLNPRER